MDVIPALTRLVNVTDPAVAAALEVADVPGTTTAAVSSWRMLQLSVNAQSLWAFTSAFCCGVKDVLVVGNCVILPFKRRGNCCKKDCSSGRPCNEGLSRWFVPVGTPPLAFVA